MKPPLKVKIRKGKVIGSLKGRRRRGGLVGGNCEEWGRGKERQYELGHRIMGKKWLIISLESLNILNREGKPPKIIRF